MGRYIILVCFAVLLMSVTGALYADTDWMCGDVDGSGFVGIGDAVWLVSFLSQEDLPPFDTAAADVDACGDVNWSDACYLVACIFCHGPSPCDPTGSCDYQQEGFRVRLKCPVDPLVPLSGGVTTIEVLAAFDMPVYGYSLTFCAVEGGGDMTNSDS